VLAISLDTVGGAVEVFGVFILFITILSFVSYYRNTFLSVFGSKNGTTVSKNKTKLQVLTKSVTHSMTAKAITVKSYFNKFLK
jgi:undecaprenyl pyrophosphate phosphatase UppP|tara:strand:+ start:1028 stop:1276 length:249 start_codon:yes stop_codon:yes gene_type:complete